MTNLGWRDATFRSYNKALSQCTILRLQRPLWNRDSGPT
jgi:hypothetical protein